MAFNLSPTQVAFNARGDGKFQLPFQEQIDFFRQKLNLPTAHWDDILHQAHDRAFIVAGAAKADLLNDLRLAVDKSIADGKSIGWFRKEFDGIVKKHGWQGWTGSETQAGRDWRTRVIYQTNLSTSYAAGRYKQLTDPGLLKLRPNWKYVHNDTVRRPRPLHVEWSGTVLPADDPWWDSHFPPNGFGCRCRITSAGRDEYDGSPAPDNGTTTYTDKKGNEHILPKGVDYGFGYTPGKSVANQMQPFIANKIANLPPPLAKSLSTDIANIGKAKIFEPQKTAKAAAQWAVDNDLVNYADYGTIHPDVANDMNKSLFDHLQEFPELRKNQKFIGTGQAQFTRWHNDALKAYAAKLTEKGYDADQAQKLAKKYVKKLKMKGTTWMHSWSQDQVSGIAVNEKWGKDHAAFIQSLQDSVKTEYHPIACDTVKSCVDHELAHQLDDLLLLSLKIDVKKLYADALKAGITQNVSGYAGKNIKEFVAECWSEALNNPSPRHYAKKLARFIRDEYKKQYPS